MIKRPQAYTICQFLSIGHILEHTLWNLVTNFHCNFRHSRLVDGLFTQTQLMVDGYQPTTVALAVNAPVPSILYVM